MSGQGGKLLVGFLALHVLCCGVLLLGGAGALTAAGALLGNGALVAAGLVAVLAVVAVGLWRSRREFDDDCCRTTTSEAADRVLSEKR
jgi:membrane protein implicated in regulation of membrane protease activity